MNARSRATSFTLAVILLAILIGWATQASWRELRRLNRNFAVVQTDSFHRAEYLEAAVRGVDAALLRLARQDTPEARARVQRQVDELKQWLQGQRAVGNPAERDLLDQIAAALEVYPVPGTGVRAGQPPAAGAAADGAAGPVPPPEAILGFCQQLSEVERGALGRLAQDSRQGLIFLQVLLFVSLSLLVALAIVMVLRVYRQTVAPLRAQLINSLASAEREEKLAALGTLAAGVAHEIRNPLTAINVRVHSLKRTLVPGSSEHDDAAVIDQEIQRLDRIVRTFLHFARPPEAQFATVSVDALFARVRLLLEPPLKLKSVRLGVEPAPAIQLWVDPEQMEQVLINLVQNAAESIARGGSITLRARTGVAHLAARPQAVVTLEVADTGTGISPAVEKRIFDPFFTTKESGTGLGLPIVARIVAKHGGAVEYRTELGRGTTFGVVLPAVGKAEHETQT